MGRFDALNQLDEVKQETKPKPPASHSPTSKKLNTAPIIEEMKQAPSELKESAFFPKQNTSLLANQQTSKIVNEQTSKPTNPQDSKEVSEQASKLANQQVSNVPLTTKEKKKYGTYLREDSILDIQILAARTKRKDHEVLQEAVDLFLETLKK